LGRPQVGPVNVLNLIYNDIVMTIRLVIQTVSTVQCQAIRTSIVLHGIVLIVVIQCIRRYAELCPDFN